MLSHQQGVQDLGLVVMSQSREWRVLALDLDVSANTVPRFFVGFLGFFCFKS